MGLLEVLGIRPGGTTRVSMLKSVDQHVAGQKYDLPKELSDRYVLRGYAEGDLSREYSDQEVHAMLVNSQVVGA